MPFWMYLCMKEYKYLYYTAYGKTMKNLHWQRNHASFCSQPNFCSTKHSLNMYMVLQTLFTKFQLTVNFVLSLQFQTLDKKASAIK